MPSLGKNKKAFFFETSDPAAKERLCEFIGCHEEGLYPAPKNRQHLREYYWLCLEHVRAYNKSWDYYAGMSTSEIEAHIRLDTVWEKPTWPLGSWHAEQMLRDKVQQHFRYGEDAQSSRQSQDKAASPSPLSQELQALALLDLIPPVTFIAIKNRYRTLARTYHPDTNNGDKDAEEKFKSINEAYVLLKKLYA